jgi:hypothetical protein
LGNSNIFEIVQFAGGEDTVTQHGRSSQLGNVTDEPIAKPAHGGRFFFSSITDLKGKHQPVWIPYFRSIGNVIED